MRNMLVRSLHLLTVCVLGLNLSACHTKAPATSANNATPQFSIHDRATAMVAKGCGYNMQTQSGKAIGCFQQAVQLEPDNREWKENLAFAFYQAHRIPEAVPIWQDLAKGTDDKASQAKRWLVKIGAQK